jgi:N-methylhydantoinase A
MALLAVDIGGTFTDLMAFDDESGFYHSKSLTTPHDFAQGIIDCSEKCGIDAASISDLIHGTTVAINTLIERKGARTGLVQFVRHGPVARAAMHRSVGDRIEH